MMNNISIARLGEVNPELASRITTLAEMLEAEGIIIQVTQSLRSVAQQNELYAQGRTLPGHIVTNAQGTESWHVLGCAVDVAPFEGTIPDWNATHPSWGRIVAVGESLGLTSGISWGDEPHLQLTDRFPKTPDDEIISIFEDGGLQAVWDAVNQSSI